MMFAPIRNRPSPYLRFSTTSNGVPVAYPRPKDRKHANDRASPVILSSVCTFAGNSLQTPAISPYNAPYTGCSLTRTTLRDLRVYNARGLCRSPSFFSPPRLFRLRVHVPASISHLPSVAVVTGAGRAAGKDLHYPRSTFVRRFTLH